MRKIYCLFLFFLGIIAPALAQEAYQAFHHHELNETNARLVGWLVDFELDGRFVRRVAAMLEPTLPEALDRFQRALKRIGVDRALKRAGVRDGDMVRCGEFEFEWSDAVHRDLPALKADHRTRIGVGKR